MSTPATAGRHVVAGRAPEVDVEGQTHSDVEGLTHPVLDEKWFGLSLAGHHFRLVERDRYVAVLPNHSAPRLLAAIPFQGDESDPRKDILRLAREWLSRRGMRHVS
jgi:hypothetical protein